jgi:endonuclease/exonuclease/phosphatase family metal-dependent hydrolase
VFESRKRSPEHERSSLKRVHATVLLALLLLAGCRTGRNYPSTEGPRYAGGRSTQPISDSAGAAMLRVVSFNIEFAQQVDSAIALLTSDPALRDADVLLLQEMNEDATRRVAEALGMWYVYYPAIYHLRTKRHFGNAVLSRWPIVDDKKILLPHHSRFARTQRTATAATIRVGRSMVRVYSTHLGTMTDVESAARRNQLRAILADAARFERVVLGGDMNDVSVGRMVLDQGYTWPTRRGPDTSWLGRLDHIFFKGMKSPDGTAAGTVLDVRKASDHLPVWAIAILPHDHR